IFVGEKLWGLMGAYQHSAPRQWHSHEVGFVAQAASHIGLAIQRTQEQEKNKQVQGVTREVKNSHSKEYMQQRMLKNCLKNDKKMKKSSYQRRRNRFAVSPSLPLVG
ncbi:MAG: GAF domain-containing protein, partial [Cyanobacteria bacterium J06628_3]